MARVDPQVAAQAALPQIVLAEVEAHTQAEQVALAQQAPSVAAAAVVGILAALVLLQMVEMEEVAEDTESLPT